MQKVITGMTSHRDGGGAVLGPKCHQKLGFRVMRMLSCVTAITARNRQATTCGAQGCNMTAWAYHWGSVEGFESVYDRPHDVMLS